MKHLLFAVGLLASVPALAQTQHLIQFTGLVVSGDSLVGVPDVRVSVLPTHRHTVTAPNGYFSLPVLTGDSIEVQAPNSTTYLRIPLDYPRASYSLLVQLQPAAGPATVRMLAADLSQRFLALKLPPQLTVETPPLSAKQLSPPRYDRKGRLLNPQRYHDDAPRVP